MHVFILCFKFIFIFGVHVVHKSGAKSVQALDKLCSDYDILSLTQFHEMLALWGHNLSLCIVAGKNFEC